MDALAAWLSPRRRLSPLAMLLFVLELDLLACVGICVGLKTGQNRDVPGVCINKKMLKVW